MKKKALVVGIIFLFIGISIAPSVTSIGFSKNKTLNKKYMERIDALNKRIEQLSDLPCECEKDTTTGWNYPVLCTYLYLLFWFAYLLWITGINDDLVFLIGDIGKELNCYWPSP